MHSKNKFRPVREQLMIGAFVRTLMQVSAALEKLLSTYPDLIERSKPFGMSIGVEVFALAENPLIDKYPALHNLVVSFKKQFLELGIDPKMVRRANEPRNNDLGGQNGEAGDEKLKAWLGDWSRSLSNRRTGGAEWLFEREQIGELLGADIYPFAETETDSVTQRQPSRYHLECIADILGPHILSAMVQIWRSSHSVVFVNSPIASFDDFESYVADVQLWLPQEGDDAEGLGLEIERLFPESMMPQKPEGQSSYEEVLEWLFEMTKVKAKADGEIMGKLWKSGEEKELEKERD
jgi:hypothetical protein